jgi:two-component system, chemotaxis family, response regulator Rcp1
MNQLMTAARQVEILLVEDHLPDLLLMMKFLKESSIRTRVHAARDGQMAMDYLRRENGYEKAVKPDLIFLDLSLPRRDGREVLDEIKSNSLLQDIPVIVVTTSASGIDVISARQAGVKFYMMKSDNLNRFLAAMSYVEEVWIKSLSGIRNN